MTPLVEVDGVVKSFGGIRALDGASLRIMPGTVHALVGENGAGKSTLIKTLTGMETAEAGAIAVNGIPLSDSTGTIAAVYQDFDLAEHLTITENLMLPAGGVASRVRFGAERAAATAMLSRVDLDRDPDEFVRNLSVSERQLVAIARALGRRAQLLIMDEPTSALSHEEIERLMTIIERSRAEGVAVLYISHKLEEVFRLSDTITVLRDGRDVLHIAAAQTTADEVVRAMVGREIERFFVRGDSVTSDPVLVVEELLTEGLRRPADFEVRAGEVVGFYGLKGAGRTTLAKALYGLASVSRGNVSVAGVRGEPGISFSRRVGIAMVPEDRKREGLFPNMDAAENAAISALDSLAHRGYITRKHEVALFDTHVAAFGIRVRDAHQRIQTLSGGNQQKVLLARALSTRPTVLILDEPTVGIDVGAKREIYDIIATLTRRGTAVVLISSELPEVLGVCHRILVMHEGEIVDEVDAAAADEHTVMAKIMNNSAREGVTG